MRSVSVGIGLVGIVIVSHVNVATIGAQSDGPRRRPHEKTRHGLVKAGFPSAAAAFDTEVKLSASDEWDDDWYGISVAMSGDTAIVGAPLNDEKGKNTGAAYVYRRDESGDGNWGEVTKLTASDAMEWERLGFAVAISGDTAIVGAFNGLNDDGTRSGAAYVYRRNEGGDDQWGEVAKLTASDGADDDGFGISVAISGDTAIVGAKDDDDSENESGSAYIFRQGHGGPDHWDEVRKISASDPSWRAQFGNSVAIDGDMVIVGADGTNVNGISTGGSAYIFRKDEGGESNWGEVIRITAGDATPGDRFGSAVGISGDTAIVGAWANDDYGFSSGSAYVFQRDNDGPGGWGEVTKIAASDLDNGDRFGFSVAISGNTAIVGSYLDDDNGPHSGSAYFYRRNLGGLNNWGELAKVSASDGEAFDLFGWSAAISGNTAIVGGRDDFEHGPRLRSAYLYFSECLPEPIGGAIYSDCDARLTSGEESVEVSLSGAKGEFAAVTSGRAGIWHVPNVPCGDYTVTPHSGFREYCRVDIGGDCPPEVCEGSAHITVDADHRAENLSIQFLGRPPCLTNDMNDDGVCAITFDAELFLQCVYDDDCVGPDGQDLACRADCNCDGMATIVYDASCFVHEVYVNGVCGECPNDGPPGDTRRPERPRSASGFTVGGAVYGDERDPLLSGVEGVGVRIYGANREVVATAMTEGPLGIWRVDGLPEGEYNVAFERQGGRASIEPDVISIEVNEANEAANLSIRLLRSPDRSRVHSR